MTQEKNEKAQDGKQQPPFDAEEIRARARQIVEFAAGEEGVSLSWEETGLKDVVDGQLTPDQVYEGAKTAARRKRILSQSAQENIGQWAGETRRKHQVGED